MPEASKPDTLEGGVCPVCARPREARFRPFCSKRCAEVDLGRWFTGAYRVPGPEAEAEPERDEDGPIG